MAVEGETLRSIAKRLTQQGVPTAKGGRVWSATTIGSILANRSYAGVRWRRSIMLSMPIWRA